MVRVITHKGAAYRKAANPFSDVDTGGPARTKQLVKLLQQAIAAYDSGDVKTPYYKKIRDAEAELLKLLTE